MKCVLSVSVLVLMCSVTACEGNDLARSLKKMAMEVNAHAFAFMKGGGKAFDKDKDNEKAANIQIASAERDKANTDVDDLPSGSKRLDDIQKCYNDLTVLAMLDDKGAFGPDDWHHIFVQMDHGGILGHKTDKGNWRLTQQEFRNGAPNCDSWLFGSMGLANDDSEIDYYEWFDVYESADGCKAPLSGAVMNGGDPGCYGGQDNIMRAEDKPAKFRVTKKMYQDQVPEPGDSSRSRDHLRRKGDTVPKVEPTVDVVSSLKAMAAADPGFKEACEKLSAEQKTTLKGSDATKYGECKTAGAAEYTE